MCVTTSVGNTKEPAPKREIQNLESMLELVDDGMNRKNV
jgi:hypothetical protein